MQFYPTSFPIDDDTREVYTQISGKKTALQDHQVNIRGVLCKQHGPVTSFAAPRFEIKRSGDGYKLTWDEKLEETLEVIIEAQGNGGQLIRPSFVLRVGEEEQEPAAPAPTMLSVEQMVAGGIDRADAEALVSKRTA